MTRVNKNTAYYAEDQVMKLIVYSCCGFSLKTGSRVISIFYTLISLILMGICLWISVKKDLNKEKGERILMIISACFIGVEAFFAMLLMFGAFMEIPCLLKTWIFYGIFSLSYFTIIFLLHFCGGGFWSIFGAILAVLAVRMFCIVIVQSHRHILTEPNWTCQISALAKGTSQHERGVIYSLAKV